MEAKGLYYSCIRPEASICAFALALCAQPLHAEMFIHFLDVGQADSTLVLTNDGCAVLIDAGRHDRDDLRGHLRHHGVEHINLLVGTHPHADHIGQFDTVMRGWPVDEVWMSGWEHNTLTFERALDAILDSVADYHEPRAGDRFTCSALEIDVIHPVEPLTDIHDNIALRVSYGDFSVIVPGDAEAQHEAEMIHRGEPLAASILRLGHHGSQTSTTQAFLNAVAPDVAIYSAGEGNRFGHPHDIVIDRVTAAGIDLYGTMTHGTITIRTDGVGWALSYARRDAAPDSRVENLQSVPDSFECIDINRASAASLTRIIQIGEARARAIIEMRRAAPFNTLDDLKKIRGIGPVILDQIREQGLACVK
jgi:competence protein ComEC